MSRYIEFETQPVSTSVSPETEVFVFNGHRPTRFREPLGISVDGIPIDLVDDTLLDRLHRTIIDRRKLIWKHGGLDCIVFVSAMEDIPAEIIRDQMRNIGQVEVTRSLSTQVGLDVPLSISSARYHNASIHKHVVSPAHTYNLDEPTYLHKLGVSGPLCLSGIRQAMDLYGCYRATPLPGRELSVCPVEYPESPNAGQILLTGPVEALTRGAILDDIDRQAIERGVTGRFH